MFPEVARIEVLVDQLRATLGLFIAHNDIRSINTYFGVSKEKVSELSLNELIRVAKAIQRISSCTVPLKEPKN